MKREGDDKEKSWENRAQSRAYTCCCENVYHHITYERCMFSL